MTYDTQYVQMGWSLAKTYGPGAANIANNGYMFGGPFMAGTIGKLINGEDADLSWFSGDNVPANIRGIQLGQHAAIRHESFPDFVEELCPNNNICYGWN